LQNAKSKGGLHPVLHPVLKETVDCEGGIHSYNLLAPDMIDQRMLDLYSDDVDTLFPQGYQSLVMNQTRLYWARERKRILDKRNGQTVEVKFLLNIKIFSKEHALKLLGNFKSTSNLDTVIEAQVLSEKDSRKVQRQSITMSRLLLMESLPILRNMKCYVFHCPQRMTPILGTYSKRKEKKITFFLDVLKIILLPSQVSKYSDRLP
jgi:hypothetical protein